MSVRIKIDHALCEAFGVCEETIPEALRLDESDHLHLRLAAIPPELEKRAREAVRSCPRFALSLVTEENEPAD